MPVPSRPAETNGRERRRDADRTRAEILDVATAEFARDGYSGARVDEIAARTKTTKRMIYYYFGGKEGLYIAVLERAYLRIRSAEQRVEADAADPVAAIRRLAELTFDHHEANPDFLRLVSVENIHHARHIAKSETLRNLSSPAIGLLDGILAAGREQGTFTRSVDAVDVHMLISSFCVFRVANRHTFGTLFERDLTDPALRTHYRTMLGDLLIAYLTS